MPAVIVTNLEGVEVGRLDLVGETVRGSNEHMRKLIDSVPVLDVDTGRTIVPDDGEEYLLLMVEAIGRHSYFNATLEV